LETLLKQKIAWPDLMALQDSLVKKVERDPSASFLLLSEPEPTFTRGISSKDEDLLWDSPGSRGIAVERVHRGGQWTYHGPGQLVIFPILFLPRFGFAKRGVRPFIERVVYLTRTFLKELQVNATEGSHPVGLYVQEKKIASVGFSIRDGITSHGIALYLEPQTAFFEGIVACGTKEAQTTSLGEQGVLHSWEEIAERFRARFESGFQETENW
jgi:lipoate-protein ligase B